MTFEKATITFLDNIKTINFGLRCTFQDPIEDQDSLLTFLRDKDYVENSDFVVKTSEITKDKGLIEKIKSNRDHFQVHQSEGMTFFVSPHIIHLGDVFDLECFEKDLKNPSLLELFDRAIY